MFTTSCWVLNGIVNNILAGNLREAISLLEVKVDIIELIKSKQGQ